GRRDAEREEYALVLVLAVEELVELGRVEHQAEDREEAELEAGVVEVERVNQEHCEYGKREQLDAVDASAERDADAEAEAEDDRADDGRGGEGHQAVEEDEGHHDDRRAPGREAEESAEAVDDAAQDGDVHAADREV